MDYIEGMNLANIFKEEYGSIAGDSFSAMTFNELDKDKQEFYNKVNKFWNNIQDSNLDNSKKETIYNLCNKLLEEDIEKRSEIIKKIEEIIG